MTVHDRGRKEDDWVWAPSNTKPTLPHEERWLSTYTAETGQGSSPIVSPTACLRPGTSYKLPENTQWMLRLWIHRAGAGIWHETTRQLRLSTSMGDLKFHTAVIKKGKSSAKLSADSSRLELTGQSQGIRASITASEDPAPHPSPGPTGHCNPSTPQNKRGWGEAGEQPDREAEAKSPASASVAFTTTR